MGDMIAGLLWLFARYAPDAESNDCVKKLVETQARWSAAHAVFDEVRDRLLAAMKANDVARQSQYYFEEACCQALFNASEMPAPFDPSAPFFVAPSALSLAKVLGVPIADVVEILA